MNDMKTDFFFKFVDEAEMASVLSLLFTDIEGESTLIKQTSDYVLDVIGSIHKVIDEEIVTLDGYHVNLRLRGGLPRRVEFDDPQTFRDQIEEIDLVYGQTPATPHRVWL